MKFSKILDRLRKEDNRDSGENTGRDSTPSASSEKDSDSKRKLPDRKINLAIAVVGVSALALVIYSYYGTDILGIDNLTLPLNTELSNQNEDDASVTRKPGTEQPLSDETSSRNNEVSGEEVDEPIDSTQPVAEVEAAEQDIISVTEKFDIRVDVLNSRSSTLLGGVDVYLDGTFVGTTEAQTFTINEISQGTHNLSVEFVNTLDRRVSENITLDVSENISNRITIEIDAFTDSEVSAHMLNLINKDRTSILRSSLELIADENILHQAKLMNQEKFTHMKIDSSGVLIISRLNEGISLDNENVVLIDCQDHVILGDQNLCNNDPIRLIEKIHTQLMHDETAIGKRYSQNVLNRWYDGISIGVAYDSDGMAVYQQFKPSFVTWDGNLISVTSDGLLRMSGTVNLQDFSIESINVHHNELPDVFLSNLHGPGNFVYQGNHVYGKLIYSFERPQQIQSYRMGPEIQERQSWNAYSLNGEVFEITFPVSNFLQQKKSYSNDGLYSIQLVAKNSNTAEKLPLGYYFLLYEGRTLSSLDGLDLWRCNYIPKHRC